MVKIIHRENSMLYLIFSDIHSNLEAFKAVLSTLSSNDGVDKYVFLGDAVGYGANPNEVLELLRSLEPLVAIRGNHDKVVAGIDSGFNFTRHALKAALWSIRNITGDNRKFLANLNMGPVVVDDIFEIAHGSPADEDDYIFSEWEARRVLISSEQWITFFGHTHTPVIYRKAGSDVKRMSLDQDGCCYQLSRTDKYLINPGSVGQPRDHNPKSSFAIFDSGAETIEIKRIEYDIESTQNKILVTELPEFLASRLSLGR